MEKERIVAAALEHGTVASVAARSPTAGPSPLAGKRSCEPSGVDTPSPKLTFFAAEHSKQRVGALGGGGTLGANVSGKTL
jgi:hypothetical protein